MERVARGSKDERKYICERRFAAFMMYYFGDFMDYRIPKFHWLMFRLLEEFTQGKFTFLLWIMFRESAKTTITKIYLVYLIAYRKKRFINWDSYDKGNAEAALFDISMWLQTNQRLIADFGQLFYEDPRMAKKHATMKRIAEFITSNGVKVKAYSTQESTRGRIFGKFRPDLYVLDDFETFKTIESLAISTKISKHIDELKSGLSVDGQVIFNCNLISEVANVAKLLEESEENPESWRSMQVNAEDENGKPVWDDKYTATEEEALLANSKIEDPKKRKVSLERRRKDLNAGGKKVYEAEMMNSPEAVGEAFFDREKIDAAIAIAKTKLPKRRIGECAIWDEYNPKHRYAIGGDTAKGVGRDSCASVGIRFKTSDSVPARVVSTFDSNTMPPDLFGYQMMTEGDYFGQCLLAPEQNNTGFATVAILKEKKYPKIYRKHNKEKSVAGRVVADEYGWVATSNNVADIYYAVRTAFDDGELEIWDEGLLQEMRKFTKSDLVESSKRSESATLVGTTRHFDKLRALCIAWEMRHHATVGRDGRKPYKQAPIESRSEFQG